MTKIKVAFDISNLGVFFGRVDAKHGINRVVEEVLTQMCKRDDVEITAVSLCGEGPLADIRALLYLNHKGPALSCAFDHSFSTRRGLTKLYSSVFQKAFSWTFDSLRPSWARAVCLRCTQAVLYILAYQYRVMPPRRIFDHKRYNVFHCPHLGLLSKDITGDLPRVLTIYDLIPLIRPDYVNDYKLTSFQRMIDRIDLRRDWVTCISEFTKGEFCQYTGMSPERVLVAPLAASPQFRPVTDPQTIAATSARFGIPEGEYFLSLAAPQPRKNLAHLIRSFFRLLDEGQSPDTYLVLAGSKEQGWMYDDIFAAARSSPKYSSRLIFTGYVPDEDLSALYSGAAAFVFPSLYEGFGLPPLEAMACGTAVITSNTSSLPEVVGGAALVVDPCDQDALCQAMLDVLTDESLRRDLGHRGLERAKAFTWERCAEETVRAYKAAADERRP